MGRETMVGGEQKQLSQPWLLHAAVEILFSGAVSALRSTRWLRSLVHGFCIMAATVYLSLRYAVLAMGNTLLCLLAGFLPRLYIESALGTSWLPWELAGSRIVSA